MKYFSKLYWKICAIFLLIMIVLGSIYMFLTASSVLTYFRETNQRLNAKVASHIAEDTQPFIDGKVNKPAVEKLFHNVMVLHPGVEVYLLGKGGNLLDYSAPDSLVKTHRISLAPLKKFITHNGDIYITGDDPRHPGKKKIFSAAPVLNHDKLVGYIYIILRGDKYNSAMSLLLNNYKIKIAAETTFFILLIALFTGWIAFYLITRDLNKIIYHVKRFQKGNWNSRIKLNSGGELHQLAETFNKMAETISSNVEHIQAIEKSRRELVANISHDLRTPLATVQGYAETLLLKTDVLSEKDKIHYSKMVVRGADELKKLVDDLFELSKLESHKIVPHVEPFSLSELVLDNVLKYRIQAKEKDINLNTNIPKNLPLAIADIGLIDRVLQNLIDNALKFTPKGGNVDVNLILINNTIEISISDTGKGIAEENIKCIFDRYQRLSKEDGNKNGVGLGLAIVKEILELHNSKIQVKNKVVSGSIFYFNLPIVKS